jgi:hypothetical protein
MLELNGSDSHGEQKGFYECSSPSGASELFGVWAPAIPSKRQQTEHTQQHTADQDWNAQRERLSTDRAILVRAHIGEDSKITESRKPQEGQ